MVDCNLYDGAVNYPTISAVADGKLVVEKRDKIRMGFEVRTRVFTATRAATTDPWEIAIVDSPAESRDYTFSKPGRNIDPDTLGWKSMADLTLKDHARVINDQVWPIQSYAANNDPFVVADNTQPSGYRAATNAEVDSYLKCTVKENGTFRIEADLTQGMLIMGKGVLIVAMSKMIAAIQANTTDTYLRYAFAFADNLLSAEHPTKLMIQYTLVQLSGTESITIGNYTIGDVEWEFAAADTSGERLDLRRVITANEVAQLDSISMDFLRRCAKVGNAPSMRLYYVEGKRNLTIVRNDSYKGSSTDQGVFTWMTGTVSNPNSVVEISFDQANSLNVLAVAAFAGVGGLVGAGVTTELERLLGNSSIAPYFQRAATILGSTTAAVVSGYASALVAAYTQGWISNSQLFDLSNHVAWISNGISNIMAAATVGVAVDSVPDLLTFFGVSNSALSIAMAAVGGAATASGVALGMASVFAKAVKHVYLGE